MTTPVDRDKLLYIMQHLEKPLKRLNREIYSKTYGILKNVQVTHRKIEKRKQKQKQIEQRENDNKMPDLSSNMSINDINTPI